MNKNGFYLIFGLQTAILGIALLVHDGYYDIPQLNDLACIFSNAFFAWLVVLIGIFNVAISFIDKVKIQKYGLTSMQIVWATFFVAFLFREIRGHPNGEWILSLGIVCIIFYYALRGNKH